MGTGRERTACVVMERHGIEWEDKGTHDKHLSVLDYKKEQRAKEIAALETVKAEKENHVVNQERRLKELAPAVKNMERLAAEFSADPEEILPEPGPLETGRAFGPQEVEQAVEAAKQQEQAEKTRKRPRRSFSRDER